MSRTSGTSKDERRWASRLPIRSLVFLIGLAGSICLLWARWEPWVLSVVMKDSTGWLSPGSFSPDGNSMVTAHRGKIVRVWTIRNGACRLTLKGTTTEFTCAAFSPDGKQIVTCGGFDDSIRIWDANTGECRVAIENDQRFRHLWPGIVLFSPDGRRLAGIVTSVVDVWDAATGERLPVLGGQEGWLASAEWSPYSKRIVTANTAGHARIWDPENGLCLAVLDEGHTCLYYAAFSPDGRRVVTAGLDNTARIWDAESGKCLRVLRGHWASVRHAAFSPDGRQVVTVAGGGVVAGPLVAGRGRDRTGRVWDCDTGRCLAVLQGHGDVVSSGVYSPDGTRIVTASSDRSARIWDARTGKCIAVLDGHEEEVSCALYSPNGARVATSTLDRTIALWSRRRPEAWWGVFLLPGLYLTAAFAAALAWSLWRDVPSLLRRQACSADRHHCGRSATPPESPA